MMIRRIFPLLLFLMVLSGASSCKKAEIIPEITVSGSLEDISFSGGEASVDISVNVAWEVRVRYPAGTEEWLTLPAAKGESGDWRFVVRMPENVAHTREATLVFSLSGASYATNVTVRQLGKLDWDLTDQFDPYFAGFLLKDYTRTKGGITYEDAISIKQLNFGSIKALPPSFKGGQFLVNLQVVYMNDNTGTSVDLGGLSHLKELDIRNCTFESLDISHNEQLERLNVSDSPIPRIDASHNLNLGTLGISGPSRDVDIEVVLGAGVRSFYAERRNLKVFDYQNATELTELCLEKCGVLPSLDLRHTQLDLLYLESIEINGLRLPKTARLVHITNNSGVIPVLELGPAAWNVQAEEAGIKQILLQDAYNLQYLFCIYNKLEELDLSSAAFPPNLRFHFNPGKDGIFTLKVAAADYETKAAEYEGYKWSWDNNGFVYVKVVSE